MLSVGGFCIAWIIMWEMDHSQPKYVGWQEVQIWIFSVQSVSGWVRFFCVFEKDHYIGQKTYSSNNNNKNYWSPNSAVCAVTFIQFALPANRWSVTTTEPCEFSTNYTRSKCIVIENIANNKKDHAFVIAKITEELIVNYENLLEH